jgi:MFS family permease
MKPGKISDNILKRSVLKGIKTKRNEILSGAGVGEDCAIFALSEANLATCVREDVLLKDKDMWCIALSFGLMWLVTGGIMSQFVPRLLSVGYTQQSALLMLTIAAAIGLVGSYFWGWLDQKIGTKPASCVYALSYIGALLLMVFAQVHIFNYIALVFVGLGIGGLLNLMPSLVAAVYGRYDFMAANSLVSPIAALIQKGAFALTAILLAKSGGDFTLPYMVFIGIDILGIVLLLCVTNNCKGKQD